MGPRKFCIETAFLNFQTNNKRTQGKQIKTSHLKAIGNHFHNLALKTPNKENNFVLLHFSLAEALLKISEHILAVL